MYRVSVMFLEGFLKGFLKEFHEGFYEAFVGVSVRILEDFYRTGLSIIIIRGFLQSFHKDSKGF